MIRTISRSINLHDPVPGTVVHQTKGTNLYFYHIKYLWIGAPNSMKQGVSKVAPTVGHPVVQSILMIRIGYNFDVINTYYKYWQFSYVGRLVFEHQLQTSGVAGQPCVGFKMGLNSSCRPSILLSYCNNLCWTLLESSQAHSTLGRSSSKPLRLLPLSSCRC